MFKKLYYPGNYSTNENLVLLIFRVVGGAFMLTHGIGKFEKLFGTAEIQFADPFGIGAVATLALTVFAEVICAILLILGLGTRFAAIPLLITMLVAAFIIHSSDGFGRQELPLLYATVYFAIALLGAGKYSIDNLLYKK